MSDFIDPVSAAGRPPERERRRRPRRAEDVVQCESAPSALMANLPVVAVAAPSIGPGEASAGSAAFAAQMLGQPGQKRGLRGGPETLDKARAAYLEAEYSGPDDRRLPTGYVKRSDV